jgi:hypothetical protein
LNVKPSQTFLKFCHEGRSDRTASRAKSAKGAKVMGRGPSSRANARDLRRRFLALLETRISPFGRNDKEFFFACLASLRPRSRQAWRNNRFRAWACYLNNCQRIQERRNADEDRAESGRSVRELRFTSSRLPTAASVYMTAQGCGCQMVSAGTIEKSGSFEARSVRARDSITAALRESLVRSP